MSPAPQLDLVVYPHRSMSRKHFHTMMVVIAVITGLAALRFLFVGAWPVAIFVAFDILAVWVAFRVSYRRARLTETIKLTETDLLIERRYPNGRRENWRLEPYWTKVKLSEDQHGGTELLVATHQQSVFLGAYLSPPERKELAVEIKSALDRWKAR